MKKLILTAIAASMIASPLAATAASAAQYQPRQERSTTVVRHEPGKTVVVHKEVRRTPAHQYRSNWRKGERFDYRQARNYRVINDYRRHHLKAPPRGYHYVRSGNDAVLVGITSGLVAGIFANAIR